MSYGYYFTESCCERKFKKDHAGIYFLKHSTHPRYKTSNDLGLRLQKHQFNYFEKD